MNHSDAGFKRRCRMVEPFFPAVYEYFSAVRLMNACQNLSESAFACAVLAYKRMTGTFRYFYRYIINRNYARKTLCYIFKL